MDAVLLVLISGLLIGLGVFVSVMFDEDTEVNELENISLDERLRGLEDDEYRPTMTPAPTGGN